MLYSCPRKVYVNSAKDDVDQSEESYAVVDGSGIMSVLMTESVCYAILDTACSSTVCGSEWLDMYIQTLSDDDKSRIVEEESDTTF